ncbi:MULTISPECIES: HAD family hydrolase [Peptoniphilus]|uniref:HAD family hydrolase n=1 Tax=Peptoniphilus TaxID=162289 RepID=UPI0008DA9D39|nr:MULTISPECIES: HAD family hydrolase [Peptoniphilus]MBS6610710.1 HAD family hydrolase [Peptoniphilus harei]MDU2109185.1 HAD family hydrolase [Peptoniphilus lacydonensis]MDU2115084.1 HAD family hydrolase [Peptoniphilus lacydonensis]MDU3751752.1 HAD family hydrolase [Peptoniphilus rhinitidis]MDU5376941.1 HAD family hydrolase [Peptoniphilus lacydonensis]
MIKAVLFDKDGTLLEFSDLWIDSVIGFLKEKDLTEEDRRSLYKKVGINENNKVEENSILSSETARDLAEIFSEFIKEDEEKIYKELDNYLLDFLKNSKSEIKETCDLKKLFEYLKSKNIIIGIFTSDNYRQAKFSMEYLKVDSFIDFYAAADLYKKKPDTEGLEIFKEKYNLRDKEIMIVGDSKVDMIFGKDTIKVGVLCGTGSKEMLEEYTENIVENPMEVLNFI